MRPDEPADAVAVSPKDKSSDRSQSDADQQITVDMLQDLVDSSQKTIDVVTQSLRVRLLLLVLTGILAASMVLTMVQLLIIANQNKDNGERVIDCTTPAGKCFREGQARTGSAVADINKVTFYASVCAPDYADLPRPQRDAAIRLCIEQGLKK